MTARKEPQSGTPRGGKVDLEKTDQRPAEDRLDDALLMTFPGSDPVSIGSGVDKGVPKPLRGAEKGRRQRPRQG